MGRGKYLDELPVPVLIHRDGRLLYGNAAFFSLLEGAGIPGSSVSDLEGQDLFDLVAPEQSTVARASYDDTLEAGQARPNLTRIMETAKGRFEVTGSIKRVDWEGEPALEIALIHVDPLLPVPEIETEVERHRRELLSRLTERERAVAQLVAEGFATNNIAARLGIAENTVRNHLRAAYRKTETHSRTELARVLWRR